MTDFDVVWTGDRFVIDGDGEGVSLYDLYEKIGLHPSDDMRDIVIHNGKWCRKQVIVKEVETIYVPVFE